MKKRPPFGNTYSFSLPLFTQTPSNQYQNLIRAIPISGNSLTLKSFFPLARRTATTQRQLQCEKHGPIDPRLCLTLIFILIPFVLLIKDIQTARA